MQDEFDQLFSSENPQDLLDSGDAAIQVEAGASYSLRFFRRAMLLDKSPETSVHAYRGMGRAHLFMKKPDKAIASLQKGLQIAPNDVDSHLQIGYAYVDAGRKGSLQEYRILQRLDRKNPQRLYAEITIRNCFYTCKAK